MNSKKFAFRAIATLLCLVMLIGMIPVYVAADSDYVVEAGTVTLDTTTTEAVDGYYTVSVPINVTTNTGLIWIDFDVNYDAKLDLVDWTEGEVFPFDQDDMDEGIVDYEMSANNMTSRNAADFEKNPFFVSYQAPTRKKDNTKTGALINLVFKVAENTPAGEYPITVTMNSILSQRDTDGTDGYDTPVNVTETATTVAGKVTVIAEEEPVDPNAPLALYEAADITVENGIYPATEDVTDAITYEHFLPGTITANTDNTRFKVKVVNEDLKLADARYVKVGYRGTSANRVFMAPLLNDYKRLYDQGVNLTLDGKLHSFVYDIASVNYTGSEDSSIHSLVKDLDAATDWANLKDIHNFTGFLLRPFGDNGTSVSPAGVYFDIAYIALFNDADKAAAYEWFTPATVTYMNGDEVFATQEVTAGDKLTYIGDEPTQEGVYFDSWDVAAGTPVPADGLTVNAVFSETDPEQYYAFGADEYEIVFPAKRVEAYGATVEYDAETELKTIAMTNADVLIDDADQINLYIPEGITASKYPYIAVGISAENLPGTQLDWDVKLSDGKRLWGKKYTPAVGTKAQKLVFAVSDYTSGESGGFSTKPADLTYSAFLFRPGVVNETTKTNSKIHFDYIAFFKTVEEANAFMFRELPKYKVTFMNGTEVFEESEVTEGNALVYPTTTPTAPAGKKFAGWDVAEGTRIEAITTVNAIFRDILPEDGFILLDNCEFEVTVSGNPWGATIDKNLVSGITTITFANADEIADGDRFYVQFSDNTIKIREYPYIAVGVATKNIPGTKLDWDTTTNPGKRLWGRSFTVTTDGNISKVVIDGPGYTGGESSKGFSHADRDSAIYTQFEIRPGVKGQTTVAGQTIAFEYVAFFKTKAEADAYVFGAEMTNVTFKVDGDEYAKVPYVVGAELVYPETPVVEGKKFAGWDVEEGTAVTKDMVVNATFVEATPVTFIANDEIFATLNLVKGEGLTYPEATPKATNKKFTGWDVEEGTAVTVGMTVNAIFADIEAPEAVVSGRDMQFGFKSKGTPGIFMNGKGFTSEDVDFNVNGDEYTATVYDPEFAWVPTTGNWKFVEAINGNYGADQYVVAYLNLPADTNYLQISYALNAPAGVNEEGITVTTDAGNVVVPATFDTTGELTTMVLDVTNLPEGAKNIRSIKLQPWNKSKNIGKGSYIELAYVAAFAAKEDAEPYAPTEEYVVPAKYDVTINPAENGTVYYNYYDEVAETVTDSYYAGENVYLWVQPAEGYIFAGWLNGDDEIVPDVDVFLWGDNAAPPYGETFTVTENAAVFAVDGALDLTPVFELEVQPVEVKVTAIDGTFTVDGGEAVAEYTADINPGTEVTLVVTANAGYKLDGWYNIADGKNVLLSKEATYVLTVGEKNAMIEVRFMDETISIATKLAVETDGNGKVSVAGGEAVENYFDYANGGENVALTPVANEGYVFAYWTRKSADGTEAFIDAEAEVEVAPLGAEVAYVANFVAEGETATLYVDAQEIVLSKSEEPAVPGRLGYVAGEWKEYVAVENVIVYKPTYVRADTTYTLTITYADGSVDTVEFKYDEGVAVVGKADSSVWTLTVGEGDPIVISYESEFVLGTAFTTDATLVEAENTEEAQAIVNAISAVYDAGANQIKFTATFELPEGATLVERGVLLTSDASVAAEMEIGTAGVIVGKIKKPVDNATKVFIINKSNVAAGATWYGRPYIIYTANGVTETLYATTISATAE